MSSASFEEVAPGVFGYFQPDGSWGLSNAGLVVAGAHSLLVDTLFDYALTRTMLDTMCKACSIASHIEVVVNTHANGDHCYGNALVTGSRVISSQVAKQEMLEVPPKKMSALMRAARAITALGPARPPLAALLRALSLRTAADLMQAAPLALRAFGRFDFRGVELRLPDETFEDALSLMVGERRVELSKVGPAHTQGDIIAYIPDARVVFAGDIFFSGLHPLAWAGTLSSCIAACERVLSLDPEVIVPGHGPLMNRNGVAEHIEYFRSLLNEVRGFVADGVPEREAVQRLVRRGFGSRALPSRLVANVNAAYRELRGHADPNDFISLFARMAQVESETHVGSG